MNNNATETIRRIKTILAQYDESSAQTLAKIKHMMDEEQKLDFSMFKDGDHFFYRGIRFVRLGEEQGGVLCMTPQIWYKIAFDEKGYNDWRKSSARKLLNSDFLDWLDKDDLLPYCSDLIADNGDTAYGKCSDYIGLLSCDLYRKYRKFISLCDERMWTCTPSYCIASHLRGAKFVRHIYPNGTLGTWYPAHSCGIAPVCIFKKEISQE